MLSDLQPDYHKSTETKPPSELLIKALRYVNGKSALDLGAGAFRDSLYLLSKGFDVVAVDSSPVSLELSQKIYNPKFEFIRSAYNSFSFESNTYDLITAQWALPFNESETFATMFEKLKQSLKVGGIFVGQFFGINDEWNTPGKRMTFHTKQEVEDLLSHLHVIQLKEEERDGPINNGDIKHWHLFHVIAEKD